jgi:hypothetical protein
MEDPNMKGAVFQRLKHSVQLLALPPKEQLELLPSFVCKGDELSGEFFHWRRVVLSNYAKGLSVDQLSAITELAGKFNWLADQGVQYWTDAAIRTSPEWEDIRRLGAGVLKAFGWPEETPPSYAHEYVSADDNIRKHRDN